MIFSSHAQSTQNTMQSNKVSIEIWSDIVCPFCFLGKRKMEAAIAKLGAEDQVEIIWRSFQLDPNFPMNTSISTNEYLLERKGYPENQVRMMTAQLSEQGKQYGIDFQFETAHSFNTSKAHQLIQWAKKAGKSNALKETLMLSYFTESLDLSETKNLMLVVEKVGLNVDEAQQILQTGAFKEDLAHDIYEAQQLGISGVPFFLFNETTSISGAQNDKVFENTLAAALKNLKPTDSEKSTGICAPDKACD